MSIDALSDEALARYARHVILPEVGEEGQVKLLNASVLIIGAGGLGSPLLLYLAAAGLGRLGIIDHDVVELSNLQRQIIHDGDQLGQAKVQSAKDRIAALNPDCQIEAHRARLDSTNATSLFAKYDIIADGSDNFATRYLVNETCYRLKKTLVSAAVVRFEGQLTSFHTAEGGPCYQCLYPEAPPAHLIPRCSTVGIFGAITGVLGSLQATEVLKEILGLGKSLNGRLLLYDGLATSFHEVHYQRQNACPLCGDHRQQPAGE